MSDVRMAPIIQSDTLGTVRAFHTPGAWYLHPYVATQLVTSHKLFYSNNDIVLSQSHECLCSLQC